MLEKVLEDINKNLERIAEAIEIKVGLDEKHRAENKIGTSIGEAKNEMCGERVEPSTEAVNQPTPTPINQTIPVQAQTEKSFTQEELAVAMSNAVSAGKMNVIMGILAQFNVQALTQIDKKDYNKLATMLIEAGVKV